MSADAQRVSAFGECGVFFVDGGVGAAGRGVDPVADR